jgi:hypothetical protein
MTDEADYPTGPDGLSAAWRDYALHLRTVLDQVGVPLPECLPGETHDCGHDYAQHCVNYAAALQAKAEDGLTHLHHGDPAGERVAVKLLEHWRGVFAAESHPQGPGTWPNGCVTMTAT